MEKKEKTKKEKTQEKMREKRLEEFREKPLEEFQEKHKDKYLVRVCAFPLFSKAKTRTSHGGTTVAATEE
jgi:SepF-like predicted cell division protein (DUF552 family)